MKKREKRTLTKAELAKVRGGDSGIKFGGGSFGGGGAGGSW